VTAYTTLVLTDRAYPAETVIPERARTAAQGRVQAPLLMEHLQTHDAGGTFYLTHTGAVARIRTYAYDPTHANVLPALSAGRHATPPPGVSTNPGRRSFPQRLPDPSFCRNDRRIPRDQSDVHLDRQLIEMTFTLGPRIAPCRPQTERRPTRRLSH
jgi:hypothetical protein